MSFLKKKLTQMSETRALKIDITDDSDPAGNYNTIVEEWVNALSGYNGHQPYQRQRQIEKVPQLLLTGPKYSHNREYYEPAVVSLGPYHYEKNELLLEAESYKLVTLQLYVSSSEKTVDFLYNKVLEVINDARKCYIDGSTASYDDKKFTQMMLQDGCFILFFVDCIANWSKMLSLNNEHLGALGFANIVRDIFLLENQIPFVVLQVLMNSKYHDKGEEILNKFFNYLNYGEVIRRREKVLPVRDQKPPLHLLELYRRYFICISCSPPSPAGSSTPGASGASGRWRKLNQTSNAAENFNYVKSNRSFSSITELKAKGISFRPTSVESLEDIKFHSYCFKGVLELVCRAISPNSKAIYLNMIAYEMCPHNPNDFRVATYIRVMKSLIAHPDDVRELRSKNILLHSLGRDEEVVKMFDEINTPAVNLWMFSQLKKGIESHCKNVCKTWVAELIHLYFSRPWNTLALFVATIILLASSVQTIYTVWPAPDKSMDELISILRNSSHINPQ